MNKYKKTYSGRDGSWSGIGVESEGRNKMQSAAVGTSQKVRSGASSQKTYKQPKAKSGGTQVYLDWRSKPAGMTKKTYTIKSGNK